MKLHDVKEVKILTDAVCREHVIVRAGRSVEDRRGIVEVANLFRAKSVDIAEDSIMPELTGIKNGGANVFTRIYRVVYFLSMRTLH